MMKKILVLMLVGAAAVCSCEKHFEIHPENYSDMIRLECVADAANDSVYLFPSLCVPTHTKLKTSPEFNITGIGMEIDGKYHEAVIVAYHEIENDYTDIFDENGKMVGPKEKIVTKYRWAVPVQVPEGAVLKVKASAEGTGDVYGETTVPAKPKVSVSRSTYDYHEGYGEDAWTTHYLKFKFDIEDKENDTGYYALQIMCRTHNFRQYTEEGKARGYEDVDNTLISSTVPERLVESSFEEVEYSSGITAGYDGFRLSFYFSGPMRLYTTDQIDGTELYVRVNPDETYEESAIIKKGERKTSYQIKLYRISPEIYRYAKADNLESNNELATLGLAPVNFTYTNIIGGSGYFGAWSQYGSEWFDNPYFEIIDDKYYH